MAVEFYSQTKQMMKEINMKFLAKIRNIIGQNVETQNHQPASTYPSTVVSTPTHAPAIVCRPTQLPKLVTRPVHSTTIVRNSTITSQQQNQIFDEVETQSQYSQLQSHIDIQNYDCTFVEEPHYYNKLGKFIIFKDNT